MPKVGMQPIRRQQLIQATLTAVDQVGMGDASIALIARLAGVSNGIISHYFQDKNGLIAATMRHLMNALIQNVRERRQALTEDSPRAHLQVIIEGNFDASQVSGPAMKTWLAFWATSMIWRPASIAAANPGSADALMMLPPTQPAIEPRMMKAPIRRLRTFIQACGRMTFTTPRMNTMKLTKMMKPANACMRAPYRY